jgi:hypothetical protein
MTRKRQSQIPDYAVSDEAAAYIAEVLMELALQFEATHFAQIRRHYQSITKARRTGLRHPAPNPNKRRTSQI